MSANVLPDVNLLPCPCCGSDSVRLIRSIEDDHSVAWHVECIDCGIQTTTYDEPYHIDSIEKLCAGVTDAVECAVRTWNYRANISNDKANG